MSGHRNLFTPASVKALVDAQTPEGLQLDFKQELHLEKESAKFELRADATAFANANGGALLFGVAEDPETGCAKSIVGIDPRQVDRAISSITQILRSRIEPPLPPFDLVPVTLDCGTCVLALQIRKSWLAPHLVEKNDESYVMQVRIGRSKVRLSETEIRQAYALQGTITPRIRRWTDERLAAILSGDAPAAMPAGPLMVLHIVPLQRFDDPNTLSASELAAHRQLLEPLGAGHQGTGRINLDGFLAQTEDSYLQLFRTGALESVCGRFTSRAGDIPMIASEMYEAAVVHAFESHAELLQRVGGAYPMAVSLTLLRARGLTMAVKRSRWDGVEHQIDRDLVRLPSVLLTEHPGDSAVALRPAFDGVWNACGFPASQNFHPDGTWRLRRHAKSEVRK